MEDVTAYHHTNKATAREILTSGFDSRFFRKVTLGFGVQCFLQSQEYPPYGGKTDGQIKVFFKDCRVLRDEEYVKKSRDRIIEAKDHAEQLMIAKEEADKIKGAGFDAYTLKAAGNRDAIVFLNYPSPIEWLPY